MIIGRSRGRGLKVFGNSIYFNGQRLTARIPTARRRRWVASLTIPTRRLQPTAGLGRYPRATILPHSTDPKSRRAPRVPSPVPSPPTHAPALLQSVVLARPWTLCASTPAVALFSLQDRATYSEVKCQWMRFTKEYSVFTCSCIGFVYSWWVKWTQTAPRTAAVDARAFTMRPLSFHTHSSNSARPRRPHRGRWPCARAPFLHSTTAAIPANHPCSMRQVVKAAG